MGNKQYPMVVPERQMDDLRSLAHQTGLSMADCLRRMLDFCLCDQTINEMMPAFSGQVTFTK